MSKRYYKPIVKKRHFEEDQMENRGSWTPDTVAHYSPVKEIRPIKQNRSGSPYSLIETYKQITRNFDMERDNRLAVLEEQYQRSLSLRPEERMSEAKYKEQRTRIEWDVAWRVFD